MNQNGSENAFILSPRRLPMQDAGEPFEPTAEWELDKLAEFAIDQLGQATALSKRSTVVLFRAGRALALAHEYFTEDRAWGKWLKGKSIPRTTAWEVIELFKRAGSEEVVAKFTPDQALKQLGIRKIKKKSQSRSGASGSGDASGGNPPNQKDACPKNDGPLPKQPDTLLLFLGKVKALLDSQYQEMDRIEWSKEDLCACKEMAFEIMQWCDNWVNEVDDHDFRKAS